MGTGGLAVFVGGGLQQLPEALETAAGESI
jgi:hypothetical protein